MQTAGTSCGSVKRSLGPENWPILAQIPGFDWGLVEVCEPNAASSVFKRSSVVLRSTTFVKKFRLYLGSNSVDIPSEMLEVQSIENGTFSFVLTRQIV